ncbi:MAG: DUF2924 domain-containing protein [Planctomycetes bacterium]|nr:DUF2924 domain-containing protein [Planctomycetota bacterium]
MEAKRRLHSGGTTLMTERDQSEGPSTLKEGARMKKQRTKPAGKARRTTSKKGASTSARMPATRRRTTTRDPRHPAAGTTITRTYKGRELRVEVREDGFHFEGETFSSLTAAALRATGYAHISGPHFWKTAARPATPTETTPTTA